MRLDGKRFITPLAIALIAIGSADILFAVDSIPAIFGLTQETYLVFAANAFSLLGLRQLFFLIDGLLDRLVYLSYGLAVILGFIGVKLVIHALHTNELPFINGGEHITAIPEIPTWLSLLVILATLVVTTVASLAKEKRGRVRAVAVEPEPADGRRLRFLRLGGDLRYGRDAVRLANRTAHTTTGSHDMVTLSKGQTVSLEKRGGGTLTRVRMGLGWDAVKKKGLLRRLKIQSDRPRRVRAALRRRPATSSTRSGSGSCGARTARSSTPATT